MKFLRAFTLMISLIAMCCAGAFAAPLSQDEAENLVNDALQLMETDPLQAIKNFEQVLAAYPDNAPTYYYCALLLGSQGETNAAMLFYNKAIGYGFRGDPGKGDVVGRLLRQYQPREFNIEYPSLQGDSRSVRIKGNPGVDNEMIKDTLKQIERMGPVWGITDFREVSVTFLRWINNDNFYEQWTVVTAGKSVDLWITFETNLPAGSPTRANIMIADKDNHPAREELAGLLKFVAS